MTLKSDQKSIKILICLGIIVSALIAYEPIRNNSFVNIDDTQYITDNSNVKDGLTLKSVEWAFMPYASNWHPLTWISHIIDYQIFGLNPVGHHVINLIFHITSVLLLFWIITSLTNSIWASAFIAAVFALHPLQVESVAWAAERKTVLSGLFWFGTIASYAWYVKRPGIARYILVFVIFAIGCLAKPLVVTLPFVLLVLDYWPLERYDGLKSILQKKRIIIEKIPLLILAAGLCVLTIIAQHQSGAMQTLEKVPFKYRIGNAFISYIAYIGKFVWPSNLAVFYPFPTGIFPTIKAAICGVILLSITGAAFYLSGYKKYLIAGWLWYTGTMIPMAGLVQVGTQAMADRYMYLPMIGLLIIAAWTIKEIIEKKPVLKLPSAITASIILIILILLTRTQAKYWLDSKTLFGHALKVTENNTVAENNYGWALFEEGQYREAEFHFRNALRIALLQQKELASLHYNIGTVLGKQKKYDEAIRHLNRAVEMEPANIENRRKLGTTLMAAGRIEEAIEQLQQALKISDRDDEIYANLGMAYRRIGKTELAIENLTKAISINPNSPITLTSLAWVLTTKEEVTSAEAGNAIKYALRACELTNYKEIVPLDTLAIAYASGGRFDEAIEISNKAIDIAKASGQEANAESIQQRIKLYETGRRYKPKHKIDDPASPKATP